METLSEIPEELVPCSNCGRTFIKSSLERHFNICSKNLMQNRQKFDSLKQRIQGTNLEQYIPTPIIKSTRPRSRSVPAVPGSGRRSSTAAAVPQHLCQFCGRSFGEKAIDRHREWCQQHNALKQQQPVNLNSPAHERMQARTKYRAPLTKTMRAKTREKYSPGGPGPIKEINVAKNILLKRSSLPETRRPRERQTTPPKKRADTYDVYLSAERQLQELGLSTPNSPVMSRRGSSMSINDMDFSNMGLLHDSKSPLMARRASSNTRNEKRTTMTQPRHMTNSPLLARRTSSNSVYDEDLSFSTPSSPSPVSMMDSFSKSTDRQLKELGLESARSPILSRRVSSNSKKYKDASNSSISNKAMSDSFSRAVDQQLKELGPLENSKSPLLSRRNLSNVKIDTEIIKHTPSTASLFENSSNSTDDQLREFELLEELESCLGSRKSSLDMESSNIKSSTMTMIENLSKSADLQLKELGLLETSKSPFLPRKSSSDTKHVDSQSSESTVSTISLIETLSKSADLQMKELGLVDTPRKNSTDSKNAEKTLNSNPSPKTMIENLSNSANRQLKELGLLDNSSVTLHLRKDSGDCKMNAETVKSNASAQSMIDSMSKSVDFQMKELGLVDSHRKTSTDSKINIETSNSISSAKTENVSNLADSKLEKIGQLAVSNVPIHPIKVSSNSKINVEAAKSSADAENMPNSTDCQLKELRLLEDSTMPLLARKDSNNSKINVETAKSTLSAQSMIDNMTNSPNRQLKELGMLLEDSTLPFLSKKYSSNSKNNVETASVVSMSQSVDLQMKDLGLLDKIYDVRSNTPQSTRKSPERQISKNDMRTTPSPVSQSLSKSSSSTSNSTELLVLEDEEEYLIQKLASDSSIEQTIKTSVNTNDNINSVNGNSFTKLDDISNKNLFHSDINEIQKEYNSSSSSLNDKLDFIDDRQRNSFDSTATEAELFFNSLKQSLERPDVTKDQECPLTESLKYLDAALSLFSFDDVPMSTRPADAPRSKASTKRRAYSAASPLSLLGPDPSLVPAEVPDNKCIECGSPFPVPSARFCCLCGTKRVV